ncbi:hypothetical protein HZU77_016725 [Neisseriaceae bacterium TC5R-5]|nr:hypothetical protein [Neisseriaceae bacterium TC5R-5]
MNAYAGLSITSDSSKSLATKALADLRTDMLEQHRAEWQRHRQQFPLTAMTDDEAGLARARLAKIAAETIRIRQHGERQTWGLDTVVEETGTSITTEELDAIYARGMQEVEERRKQAATDQAAYRAEHDDNNGPD